MMLVGVCGGGCGGNSESDAGVLMFDKYFIEGITTFAVDSDWVSYNSHGGDSVNNPEGIRLSGIEYME